MNLNIINKILELKKNEQILQEQQFALLQNLKNLEHLQNLLAKKEQKFNEENGQNERK